MLAAPRLTVGSTSRRAWVALVGAAGCWGSVVVTIKIAARGIPVATITVIETGVAVVLLGGVLLARRTPLHRPAPRMLAAGVLEPGLTYPLINAGLARTSGAHGAIIVGTESVVIVVLAAAITRSRPARRVVMALLITAAGAAVVGSGEGGSATVSGDLLVAVGIVCAAGFVVLAQRLITGLDAVTLTFWQFATGTAVVVPIAAIAAATSRSGSWWGQPTNAQVSAAVIAGVVGSAGAFVLYNWALEHVTTAAAGISLTLIPVFGIAFSAILLHEPLTATTLFAALAVIAGVTLTATGVAGVPVTSQAAAGAADQVPTNDTAAHRPDP